MDSPTDAAVETLANDLANIYRGSPGLMKDRMLVVARHVITRQPGPEDVERIIETVWPYLRTAEPRVKKGIAVYDSACDCASAILALYPAPAAPVRTPTRSALDSALDPMLGNTPVRKAVVDMVLGLFEGARRPLTEAIIQELLLQTAEATHDLACAVSDSMAPQAASDIGDVRARLQSVINKLADMDDPLAPMDSAASDRLAWLEKTHVETMEKESQELRRLRLIHESDQACIKDTLEHLELQAARIATLEAELAATPPPGMIRLGEGLTEAHIEQIGKIVDCDTIGVESGMFIVNGKALKNRHGDDHFVSTMEVNRLLRNRAQAVRNALRVSVTPKPEAVDWVKIAKDRPHTSEERYSSAEVIAGLCEKIAALRAGGV